jgi:hypothetical protein
MGLTYAEWSVKWWQWITSIPEKSNPAFDLTGKFVYNGQNLSNVTFLCQTIEGKDTIPHRKCNLSSSSFFFMPIINWISIFGVDGNTDDELINIAREKMNVIEKLELHINESFLSSSLRNNRVLSSFFDINLPKENIFDLEEGKRRCVSDGYWIFFQNKSNSLFVSTSSSCSTGITKIEVEYNLSRG